MAIVLKNLASRAQFYAGRFAFQGPVLTEACQPNTRLVVVIPCHDEPDLLTTLASLYKADPTLYPVEVITVINHARQAPEAVRQGNLATLKAARQWQAEHVHPKRRFHFIYAPDLPPKDAGVGLARKIGMDEALMRLASQNQNGGIVCLDADCEVAPNYLAALEAVFTQDCPPASVSIYFEHPFPTEIALREGIVQYELFLRYYVEALRWAGYPYAFHTVGSSMAVRADVYARSGGMNRRKAGEDFYFLHKIAPLGAHYALCHTAVYPSPRVSHRVPFGTGKAQEKWLRQKQTPLSTYSGAIFKDLRKWLSQIKKLYLANETQFEAQYGHWPEGIRQFFPMDKFCGIHREIRQKSSTETIYFKHLFARLDGFQMLKMVHFLRDKVYGEEPIEEAAFALARQLGYSDRASEATDLLHWYRHREKSNLALTC
ncbi:MAG: hypothetical protein OHK0053_12970 [Microscillaceae bacterium]